MTWQANELPNKSDEGAGVTVQPLTAGRPGLVLNMALNSPMLTGSQFRRRYRLQPKLKIRGRFMPSTRPTRAAEIANTSADIRPHLFPMPSHRI